MTHERPEDDLIWAYRGTAAFLRSVSQLTDARLFSERDGIQPARVIAEISYRARGYARLAEETRLGSTSPIASEDGEYAEAVELGTTLPARALRHLVEHSSIHLRVEWRDLPDALWDLPGRDVDGVLITPRESVRSRMHAVWTAAAALSDVPVRLPDAVR